MGSRELVRERESTLSEIVSDLPYLSIFLVFPHISKVNSGTITSRFEAQIWARSRRSQGRRWFQEAAGTPSAREDVFWVYPVVAHPGEVLPACGKRPGP